jgi:26S proteasome regulatory subunit N2
MAEQTDKVKIDPRLQATIEGIFQRCISEGEYKQVRSSSCQTGLSLKSTIKAIGIALEAHRLDVIAAIYKETKDASLLSYAMEGVLDTGFSLLYRNQVLRFLLPLFPQPTTGESATHTNSIIRLLVTLGDPALTIPFLNSLVASEKLLAYQFAFDLVEGGSQDFLETLRTELPQGDQVSSRSHGHSANNQIHFSNHNPCTTNYDTS